MYVNYGCGSNAPIEWNNFDASPTLIYEKINIFKTKKIFPANVKYGNIVKGLPIKNNSCDGVYCSHVLEHLAFNDFLKALNNTYKILKNNGVFRLIMPDLEYFVKEYIKNKEENNHLASNVFIKNTSLGLENRQKGLIAYLKSIYGNSKHLWLWDKSSTYHYLKEVGFKNIKESFFGKYTDDMFKLVDIEGRYNSSFCLEMTK